MRSVEMEYKLTKVKATIKIYENPDPAIEIVCRFDERAAERGHHSFAKDAVEFPWDLNLQLKLPSGFLLPRERAKRFQGSNSKKL